MSYHRNETAGNVLGPQPTHLRHLKRKKVENLLDNLRRVPLCIENWMSKKKEGWYGKKLEFEKILPCKFPGIWRKHLKKNIDDTNKTWYTYLARLCFLSLKRSSLKSLLEKGFIADF